MHVSEVIRVARPIDEVFDAWLRFDQAGEYAPGVLDRRVIDGGTIGKGSRIAAVDRWPGYDLAYSFEVTVVQPHERVAATFGEPLSGGWDAIFDDTDGVTELRLEVTLSPGGVLGLAMPLLHPWARRRWRATMLGFSRWVEAKG